MHKGVILLVEATDEDDARERADSFMDEYENRVWDWYVVGGRWSGTLNKHYEDFDKKAIEIIDGRRGELFSDNKHKGYITTSDLEKRDVQIELQNLWEGYGYKTLNPYLRERLMVKTEKSMETLSKEDDIRPLKDCIGVVKEWSHDSEKMVEKHLLRGEEYRAKGEIKMYGYYLSMAGDLAQQNFSFETNVFNVRSYDFSIPEDIENFYAVMIDMHN